MIIPTVDTFDIVDSRTVDTKILAGIEADVWGYYSLNGKLFRYAREGELVKLGLIDGNSYPLCLRHYPETARATK